MTTNQHNEQQIEDVVCALIWESQLRGKDPKDKWETILWLHENAYINDAVFGRLMVVEGSA